VGRQWPFAGGWEILSSEGLAGDPNALYASQSSGWFGQQIQRSNDGGKTWEPVGNKFVYDGVPGTHQWYDGTAHPWEFQRAGISKPSLSDPDTVYAGVEMPQWFRTTDGGQNWQELSGLRGTALVRTLVVAGAGGMVPAHNPDRSQPSGPNVYRRYRRRCIQDRRWRQIVAPHQSGG